MAVALIVKYSLVEVLGTLSFVFRDCLVDENIIFYKLEIPALVGFGHILTGFLLV